MNRIEVQFIRTGRRIIESAQLELGSLNRRELADPDSLPAVFLRATVVEYDDPNWLLAVGRPPRRKLKLQLQDGRLTWRGVPYPASNADEIVAAAEAALRAYF